MKFQRIALFSFGVKTTLMLAHTQDLSLTRFQTITPNCSIEQNTCEKTWDEHVYFLHWQCAVLREEEAPGQTRGDPGGEAAGWVEARCRHLHSSAGGVREQSQLTSYTNTIVYSLSSSEPCKKYNTLLMDIQAISTFQNLPRHNSRYAFFLLWLFLY